MLYKGGGQHFRGYSTHGIACCHVTIDDRISTNDGVSAYMHSRKNADPLTNPDVIVYDDRAFTGKISLERRQISVTKTCSTMGVVSNQNITAYENVIPYPNLVNRADVNIEIQYHAVSNNDAGLIVLIRIPIPGFNS